MKRRFVVGLNEVPKEQEKEIVRYMNANGFGWWHWLDNFWMVIDRQNILSTEKLRDDLRKIAPDTNMMVIEVVGYTSWSGFGPTAPKGNMFDWIHKTWGSD